MQTQNKDYSIDTALGFKVGDTVAYSAKFLRDIADYSHSSASKRGVITEIVMICHDMYIAEIDGQFGCPVNLKNLKPVRNGTVIE